MLGRLMRKMQLRSLQKEAERKRLDPGYRSGPDPKDIKGGLSEETHRLVDGDLKYSRETQRLAGEHGADTPETRRQAGRD
jgi:hypothetical protein